MANHLKKGEPGRACKSGDVFSARAFVRMTPAQYDRFLALGGSKWLREQIDIAEGRHRAYPLPTAHQPFPVAASAVVLED